MARFQTARLTNHNLFEVMMPLSSAATASGSIVKPETTLTVDRVPLVLFGAARAGPVSS